MNFVAKSEKQLIGTAKKELKIISSTFFYTAMVKVPANCRKTVCQVFFVKRLINVRFEEKIFHGFF